MKKFIIGTLIAIVTTVILMLVFKALGINNTFFIGWGSCMAYYLYINSQEKNEIK